MVLTSSQDLAVQLLSDHLFVLSLLSSWLLLGTVELVVGRVIWKHSKYGLNRLCSRCLAEVRLQVCSRHILVSLPQSVLD